MHIHEAAPDGAGNKVLGGVEPQAAEWLQLLALLLPCSGL